MSRVCLCLTGATVEAAVEQVERYRPWMDMAELRVDLLDPARREAAADLPRVTGIPMILTVRLPADGGRWGEAGESEGEREELLEHFLSRGCWDWVDLEYDRPMASVAGIAEKNGTRIIRSAHDFTSTTIGRPEEETISLLRSMSRNGAIPKLAVSCPDSRSLLKLARISESVSDIRDKVILGMGEYGTPTRILAGRMGCSWTYTSPAGGENDPEAAAPGQLDPRTLGELYRFGDLGPETPLYAVTGNPVSHSRSPIIHNRWLQESGLPGTYLPMRSDDVGALLKTCETWGITGLSVTVPHKHTALEISDDADAIAVEIGAANTLLCEADGWRASNTDAGGFMEPLPEALGLAGYGGLRGMRALVIGAGGAARAAVHALNDAGVSLVILNRTAEKARSLADEVGAEWGSLEETSAGLLSGGVDFAVQTGAAGMHPNEGVDPLPWWDFRGCRLAYDMVYVPDETAFLKHARLAGVKTMNGEGMLENQAALQFEMFTGNPVPGRSPE